MRRFPSRKKSKNLALHFQENIVPYLMVSIKRLHYDKGFYPALDVDGLYEILNTNETQALALIINPALLGVGGGSSDASNQGSNAFERSVRGQAKVKEKVDLNASLGPSGRPS